MEHERIFLTSEEAKEYLATLAMVLLITFIIIALTVMLSGCGSGDGEDLAEDNRICIVDINNQPNVNIEQTVAEAEEEELDVEEILDDSQDVPLLGEGDGPPPGFENVPVIRQVAICGEATEIDAIISNPLGREALSYFLATGVRTAEGPSDSEEVI